jgi:hypothetical protein
VNGNILAHEYDGRQVIPGISFERYIFDYLPMCLRTLSELGANAPLLIAIALLGTRGLIMGADHDTLNFNLGYPITSDSIILPETVVEDISIPAGKILKPMFDLLWNACGFPASENFDSEGNWINRQTRW